jgi:hypothetical protein
MKTLQEVKLPQPKLTKELVVVPGYQVGATKPMQLPPLPSMILCCIALL